MGIDTLVKHVVDTGTTGFVLLISGFLGGFAVAWSFLTWYYKEEIGKIPGLKGQLAEKDSRIKVLEGQLAEKDSRIKVLEGQLEKTGTVTPPTKAFPDPTEQIHIIEIHVKVGGRDFDPARLRILDNTQIVYVIRHGGGKTSNVILQNGKTENVEDSRLQLLNP